MATDLVWAAFHARDPPCALYSAWTQEAGELLPRSGLSPYHFACFARRLDLCHAAIAAANSLEGLCSLDTKSRTPVDLLPLCQQDEHTVYNLFTWGVSDDWQLGNVVSVRVAKHYCVALTLEGEVWTFGEGGRGKLGLGSEANTILPQHVPLPVKIVHVSAGEFHCLAVSITQVSETRGLFAWGDNEKGELGYDDIASSSCPLQVYKRFQWVTAVAGKHISAGLTAKGEAVIWGDNAKDQHFHRTSGKPTCVALGHLFKMGERATAVAVSEDHGAVATTEQTLYLSAVGRTLIVHVPKQFGLTTLTQVVLLNDSVYCLGDNGDLFYLPRARLSHKKEHYVMEVLMRSVQWVSEGSVAFAVGGKSGEFFEVEGGKVRRLAAVTGALAGGTNSSVYAAVLPCRVRPRPECPAGLLSLADICQYHLLPTVVPFTQSLDNICQMWMYADAFDCQILREYTEGFLADNVVRKRLAPAGFAGVCRVLLFAASGSFGKGAGSAPGTGRRDLD